MSKRNRLLNIIEQFTSSINEIPSELESELIQAKQTLEKLTDEQFDQMAENVFTTPAAEHKYNSESPDNLLQSLYGEMERVARHAGGDDAYKAIKDMQNYYGIEEKDGFFP